MSLRKLRRLGSGLTLAALLMVPPALTAATTRSEATASLQFETVDDGRCHILSEGGKLTLLKNTHPSKSIHYRLERLFVDRPQGLMDGVIGPNDAVQKLGCSKVGGRLQHWRVKRATFAPE